MGHTFRLAARESGESPIKRVTNASTYKGRKAGKNGGIIQAAIQKLMILQQQTTANTVNMIRSGKRRGVNRKAERSFQSNQFTKGYITYRNGRFGHFKTGANCLPRCEGQLKRNSVIDVKPLNAAG